MPLGRATPPLLSHPLASYPNITYHQRILVQNQALSKQAKTIFSPPFSLAEFQEYFCKDGFIAKTHLAV